MQIGARDHRKGKLRADREARGEAFSFGSRVRLIGRDAGEARVPIAMIDEVREEDATYPPWADIAEQTVRQHEDARACPLDAAGV
jgi:hypothetical protein